MAKKKPAKGKKPAKPTKPKGKSKEPSKPKKLSKGQARAILEAAKVGAKGVKPKRERISHLALSRRTTKADSARPKPAKSTRPAADPARDAQAPMQLMQMVMGFMVSKAVSAAAKLGIPDELANGPRYYVALASAVGADQKALHRLMRALTSVGVFSEVAPGTYALTPVSNLLRSDVPGSLRAMAVMVTTPSHWLPWGRLEETLRKGISVAEDVFGKPLWDYFKDNHEEAAWFNGAMTSFSGLTASVVAETYDFQGVQKIVDIGGGHGFFLSTLLRKAAGAEGMLYDLPQVIQTMPRLDDDVAKRITADSGDFFRAVPEGGDLYTLKHIIHDWADDQCRQILTNIRNAMVEGGRVLIVNAVLPPQSSPDAGFLMDMNMLAMTPGGCERTEKQFKDLCAASGLKVSRIIPTPSPISIVEAVKA
ncbi:MAG: hypothetical protein IPP14_12390 [Planctomycetes bacterium]|nr:hypothetical protein [Planctomycetota bacterium]